MSQKSHKDQNRNSIAANQVNRGTQDELEVLRLIIQNNPVLKQAVLAQIREAKTRNKPR